MSAAARLGTYALILAAVFAAAFLGGGLLVPDDAVSAWTEQTEQTEQDPHTDPPAEDDAPQRQQREDHGTADH